ncbi:MAG: FHA domain-containing protein [Polyangiaceae bacterium]|nr:FHA domain-containing protein [Polyangiaceae bacterium]
MWKLTIEDDEGKPTSLPLVHDEYTLGRGETNAIRLTDRNVSRKHAVLKKNGVAWVLSDLQSYNGTFVNNERVVGDRNVASGDVMMLGDYRLILTDEATAAANDPSRGSGPALPVQYRPNRLVIVVGPAPGTEFPLDKDHFTIGRSEEATISINHSSVSRIHSELIALGGGRFEIIDKGSANGIRVNGVELKRGILEAGDALELGDVRLRFVGAGKVFRSSADQSQQLPAVGAGVGADAARGLSTGKIAGIVLAVIAVLVVVVFALVRPGSTNAGSGSGSGRVVKPNSAEDNGAELLGEAKKLFDGGDIEGAHKKVGEIPEGSAAFEGDGVSKIENAWADWIFKKADEAKTNDEKRALLKQVPPNTNVDQDRRSKALDAIAALPPEPAATPGVGVGVGVGAGPGPNPGTTAATAPTTTSEPAPTKSTTSAATPPTAAPTGAIDEAAIRKGLEPKVWSGRATEAEIRMLKAICSHMGDRACRDRAAAMLKQKQEQNK